MAAKKSTTKKGHAPPAVPVVPPLPSEAQNNPIVEGLPTPPAPPAPEPTAAEKKAQAQAAKDAVEATKERESAIEKQRKDEASRTVSVRAIRRGQYPATGGVRNPGEVFDYIRLRRADGSLEEKLPSWVEHVDGDLPSRTPGEPAPAAPPPPAATVGGVTAGQGSRSVI